MSSGQYKRSLGDFDSALELDGGLAKAHLGRAELCCIINDKEEAVRSYERYLALVREDAEPSVVAEAYLTYGELLFDLSREQEALEQFHVFHRTQAVGSRLLSGGQNVPLPGDTG